MMLSQSALITSQEVFGFPCELSLVKESACDAGDCSITESRYSPEKK